MKKNKNTTGQVLRLRKNYLFILLAIFSFLSSGAVYAQETTQNTDADMSEEPAYVSYLTGNVEVDVTPDNEMDDFAAAELEMDLSPGTIIRTGKDALCEITLADESTIKISSGSVFQIESMLYNRDTGKKKGRFKLMFGKVRARVQKVTTKDSKFEITSGTSLAGVRGTSFGVLYDGAKSQVLVFAGSVNIESITGIFEPIILNQGQMSSIPFEGLPGPVIQIPEDVMREWEAELEKFVTEAAAEEAPAPAPEVKEAEVPEKPAEKAPKKESLISKYLSLNAYVGTVTIDDSVYARWIFTPEFTVGKLGVGLYLPAIFSPAVGLFGFKDWENHDEWDFKDLGDGIHDFLIKFYYISWGSWGDPLYFKIGSIDDFNLGHGFIVDNYSNMLYFPEELSTGMQLNIDAERGGIETMISEFSRHQLFGARLYLKPLGRSFPLAFGISGVHDKPKPAESAWPVGPDPGGELTESEDQLPRIFVFGADIELPLLRMDLFSLKLYTDAATIGYMYEKLHPALAGANWVQEGALQFVDGLGTAAGVMGKIAKIVHYRLEYRYIFNYYEPGFINYLWENRRLTYQQELLNLIIAQNAPSYENSTSSGFFISGGATLLKKLEFGIGYENYEKVTGSTETTIQKGNAYVNVSKGLVPKVYGGLSYDRSDNLENIFKEPFDENTLLEAKVFYELAPTIALSVHYKRTFRYNDATREYDPIDSFGINTIFSF